MSQTNPLFENDANTPASISAEQVVDRRILKQARAARRLETKKQKMPLITSYREGKKKNSIFHNNQRSETIEQILSYADQTRLNVGKFDISNS